MGGRKRAPARGAEELWLSPSGGGGGDAGGATSDDDPLGSGRTGGGAPATVEELRERVGRELAAIVKASEASERAGAAARKLKLQELHAALEADGATTSKMLSRVGALERQLAEEAADDKATLARLSAAHTAALKTLDDGFEAKAEAIRKSMKRLKEMAKSY